MAASKVKAFGDGTRYVEAGGWARAFAWLNDAVVVLFVFLAGTGALAADNAMQIGVFQLLQARRDQLEAGRSYVATLLEYWRSRAALEQILMGRMVESLGVVSRSSNRGPSMSSSSSGDAHSGGGTGGGH